MAVRKKAKKKAASRRMSVSSGASENFAILTKAGVVIDPERITDAERKVIDSLSGEEIDALVSAHEKFSDVQSSTSGLWRAFCF